MFGQRLLQLARNRHLRPRERHWPERVSSMWRCSASTPAMPAGGNGDACFRPCWPQGSTIHTRRRAHPAAAGCARASAARTPRGARHGQGSKVATSLSMKRRRSPAGPANSRSMAGVSQTRRRCSARAPELFCKCPSMSTARLAVSPSPPPDASVQPVPSRTSPCRAFQLSRNRPGTGAALVLPARQSLRRGGHGQGPAARWLRADWSCPRHSAHAAPSGCPSHQAAAPHSCGSW